MKLIALLCLATLAGCNVRQRVPSNDRLPAAPRPLMDSALAASICTNPGAASVLGADCVMRDQSPPARLLPPKKLPK